jgi:WD40 repeat protein
VRSTPVLTAKSAVEALSSYDGDYPLHLRKHRDFALVGAISPDGTTIATSGADGTIRLWMVETGEALTVFKVHDQQVAFLEWLPDGSGIVSIGNLGEVRLLDSIPRAERMKTR